MRVNYFVICPNHLGLNLFLNQTLNKIAAAEDVQFIDAATLTKEKARQTEKEVRMAPRGSSSLTHIFIHNLTKIPSQSVGPLLKAVEEAKFARFIFQTQAESKKLNTLMSRSTVIRLSFLSKTAVLGNMKALHLDAKTADQLNLYDGTLIGTINALQMKDMVITLTREMKRGSRGLTALFQNDLINSLAFQAATYNHTNEKERNFLSRIDNPTRRKLILITLLERMK